MRSDRIDIDLHPRVSRREFQVSQPRCGYAVLPPAMDGGQGYLGQPAHSRRSAQRVDDLVRDGAHSDLSATIADGMQAVFCDNESRKRTHHLQASAMTPAEIRAELDARNMNIRDLAEATGINENYLSKSLGKQARRIQVDEMRAIEKVLTPEDDEHERIRTIPLLGSVPAGSPRDVQQKGGRRIAVSDPDTPKNAYALTVQGDSMDLIVPDGTTLVIDPDDIALWPGWRYVVEMEDGSTTYKEFQGDPPRLVPCSSNPEHREILLGARPIVIKGKVFSYTMRDIPRRRA